MILPSLEKRPVTHAHHFSSTGKTFSALVLDLYTKFHNLSFIQTIGIRHQRLIRKDCACYHHDWWGKDQEEAGHLGSAIENDLPEDFSHIEVPCSI